MGSLLLPSGGGVREGTELLGGEARPQAARRQQRHLLVQEHARRSQEDRDEDEGAAGREYIDSHVIRDFRAASVFWSLGRVQANYYEKL